MRCTTSAILLLTRAALLMLLPTVHTHQSLLSKTPNACSANRTGRRVSIRLPPLPVSYIVTHSAHRHPHYHHRPVVLPLFFLGCQPASRSGCMHTDTPPCGTRAVFVWAVLQRPLSIIRRRPSLYIYNGHTVRYEVYYREGIGHPPCEVYTNGVGQLFS